MGDVNRPTKSPPGEHYPRSCQDPRSDRCGEVSRCRLSCKTRRSRNAHSHIPVICNANSGLRHAAIDYASATIVMKRSSGCRWCPLSQFRPAKRRTAARRRMPPRMKGAHRTIRGRDPDTAASGSGSTSTAELGAVAATGQAAGAARSETSVSGEDSWPLHVEAPSAWNCSSCPYHGWSGAAAPLA